MTDRSNTDGGSDDVTGSQITKITSEIGEDEQPSEVVVRATAALTDTAILDLDPLFDTVDPNHLDGLFCHPETGSGNDERSVTFTFNRCHVSVTGQRVVVRATDELID